jgi:hypothetical protein
MIWSQEKIEFLRKWWPHWGTYETAKQLNIPRPDTGRKAQEESLHALPKMQRLCSVCSSNFQGSSYSTRCSSCVKKRTRKKQNPCSVCGAKFQTDLSGTLCPSCFKERKRGYRAQGRTLEGAIAECLRNLRRRSAKSTNLTFDYLYELWQQQTGRCYYSGVPLQFDSPKKNDRRRNPLAPSVDRIDPNGGYMKDNVVWCCFACNAGKYTLSQEQYIDLCRKVASCHQEGSSAILASTIA